MEAVSLDEKSSFVELCRSSWHPVHVNANKKSSEFNEEQTYLRGCKWSPDGTCCLTVVNNDGVHLLELPGDLLKDNASVDRDRSIDLLDSIIHIPEYGLVYDFCWYPHMNSALPETCCWMTTARNKPVQIWDAFDGSLRCSYRGYDAVDEVEPAISICFSNDASQIHAGYKKTLKTFDVERPGREYVNQKICSSAACLAVSPTHDLIAVGSWKSDISLYSIQQGSTKSLGKLRCHNGGVTQVKFFPDGSKLISGARKDNQMNIWDIRFYKNPLKTLYRKVETNQRIYFDVSKCGKYIISGSTDGLVHIWNVSDICQDTSFINEFSFSLHKDCCNGVSIHPHKPILATSSGQHHFSNDIWLDDKFDCNEESKTNNIMNCDYKNNGNIDDKKLVEKNFNDKFYENSLEFWWLGSIEK